MTEEHDSGWGTEEETPQPDKQTRIEENPDEPSRELEEPILEAEEPGEPVEEEAPDPDYDNLMSRFNTEWGFTADQTLDWVIKQGYPPGSEDDLYKTGMATFPAGLMSWWKKAARQKKVDVITIQRMSYMHGFDIALHDRRIQLPYKLYDIRDQEVDETGDRTAMLLLEQKDTTASFVKPITNRTSVGIFKKYHSSVSHLSSILGLSFTLVYCFLSLLSMRTAKGHEGRKKALDEELSYFWELVEKRTKSLMTKKELTVYLNEMSEDNTTENTEHRTNNIEQ